MFSLPQIVRMARIWASVAARTGVVPWRDGESRCRRVEYLGYVLPVSGRGGQKTVRRHDLAYRHPVCDNCAMSNLAEKLNRNRFTAMSGFFAAIVGYVLSEAFRL